MREEKLKRELQQVRNPKLNNNENLKDYTPLYERVKTVIDQKKKKLTETELLVKLEKEEKLKTQGIMTEKEIVQLQKKRA